MKVVAYKVTISSEHITDVGVNPFLYWGDSEEGEWVKKHTLSPLRWYRIPDSTTDTDLYKIEAELSESDYVFWKLKFK